MDLADIIEGQRRHWTELSQRSTSAVQAVGSESLEHKYLRYGKLAEIFPLFTSEQSFSVHDVGCGVGDFYGWLKQANHKLGQVIDYHGSDITSEYLDVAKRSYPEVSFQNLNIMLDPVKKDFDYVILSGVFHQNGGVSRKLWTNYMEKLLQAAWIGAKRAIAFNVLTSDVDFFREGNFYVDLPQLQNFVTHNLSRFYQVDTSYPLFEATIFVYKEEFIRSKFLEPKFQRYFSQINSDTDVL